MSDQERDEFEQYLEENWIGFRSTSDSPVTEMREVWDFQQEKIDHEHILGMAVRKECGRLNAEVLAQQEKIDRLEEELEQYHQDASDAGEFLEALTNGG